MYDPNSVLGRGVALRESQQAGKKRKPTQVCLNAPAGQPAVQNTKKKNRMATRNRPRPLAHTHTHTT